MARLTDNITNGIKIAGVIIQRASTTLTLLVIISCCVLLTNALLWSDIPELFSGADEVNNLVMNFLQALVASYVFHIVVNVYPEYKQQHYVLNTKLNHLTAQLISEFRYYMGGLYSNSQKLSSEDMHVLLSPKAKEALLNRIKHLDFSMMSEVFTNNGIGDGRVSKARATWRDVFTDMFDTEERIINEIYIFERYMPYELLDVIHEIQNSPLRKYLRDTFAYHDPKDSVPLSSCVHELAYHFNLYLSLMETKFMLRTTMR